MLETPKVECPQSDCNTKKKQVAIAEPCPCHWGTNQDENDSQFAGVKRKHTRYEADTRTDRFFSTSLSEESQPKIDYGHESKNKNPGEGLIALLKSVRPSDQKHVAAAALTSTIVRSINPINASTTRMRAPKKLRQQEKGPKV